MKPPQPEQNPQFSPEDLEFSPRDLTPEEMAELKRISGRFYKFAGVLFLASGWLSSQLLHLGQDIILRQMKNELSPYGWVCVGLMALGISWGRIRIWLKLRKDIKDGTALSGRKKGTGPGGKIVWEYLPVSKMVWAYQEKRATVGA